ncbi:hypothetical protein [Legionella tucsonensis]|uniref:Dot/Icm T4SS effector n=1 Tax=Legionella tucsonensis TaxID=40335 RepID=A0A0W0ZUC9_9GAMM|nr:hypothetical protein [Legionella tucsonensis]KTD72666.1 Dot/Icm T4SS effector [Legionella tucsonensis]
MSGTKIEIGTERSKTHPHSEVLDETLTLELQERTVDNPAKGNCGYYAFAIGLINIIQQEGTGATFGKWVHLDPSIIGYYDAICNFDFDKPNNDLLEVLQRSLRLITYNAQVEELRWACTSAQKKNEYRALVATSTYKKFAEMYYGTNVDPHFNQFVSSPAIKTALAKIDPHVIRPGHEALVLAPLFMSLIYGEGALETINVLTKPKLDSPVIQALQNITQDFVWATHLELDYLANEFEVNLHVLKNGVNPYEFHDLPYRNTITIDNQSNIHWTTRVIMAKKVSKTLAPISHSEFGSSSKRAAFETRTLPKKQQVKDEDTVTKKLPIQEQYFSKREVGKQKKTQPEVMNLEKTNTQLHFLKKQTLFNQSDAIPLTLMSSKTDQKELNRLIHIVHRAVIAYCTYSDGIIFSLFHRHGESGRIRASMFDEQFSLVEDLEQAKNMLMDFLEDSKNGNTHPHSFRTMLLQGLLAANESHNKKDLKYISKNYLTLLEEFREELIADELVIV